MMEKRVLILKEGMSRNRWLVWMIRLAWGPERGDFNNPVTRCPSLLRWLGSPWASSHLEEGLMTCCCCVTPEGNEEVSGRRRWRLSDCFERFSILFLETAGKVLANGTGCELAPPPPPGSEFVLFKLISTSAPPLLLKERDCFIVCLFGQDLVLCCLNES